MNRSDPAGSGIKPFRIFKYFTLASFLVVTAYTVMLSIFMFHQAKKTMLHKNETFAALLAENLNNQVFRKFVLPTFQRYRKIKLRDKRQYDLLNTVVNTTIYGFNVETINLYSHDFLLVYSTGYSHDQMLEISTQQEYLGRSANPGIGLTKALKGETSSSVISLGNISDLYFSEEKGIRKLRTFAPFRVDLQVGSKTGPVMGELEIILDITQDFRDILEQQLLAISMAGLIMGLLFLTLLLIVRRAEQILGRRLKEKERLEQELNQAARLAGLGRMVAGVSHEIRNPLGIIKSTAEILAQRMQRYEPDNRLADVIVEESNRMNAIVTEFLDFARPQVPKPTPCFLTDIIERNLTFLQPQLVKQQIKVEKLFSSRLGPVMADPDLLYRGLLNVFNNAIQAMPEGGTLKVGVHNGKENGTSVQKITVQDTGDGIPSEAMENLFTPFFTTREKGTGLGLAILKNIVEGHHGKVAVDSPVSSGSYVSSGGTMVSIILLENLS